MALSLTRSDIGAFGGLESLLLSSCQFEPGDANNSGRFDGLDVVYGVNYLKGHGAPPILFCDCPPHGYIYVAADANGNCAFNGIDVTYGVNYLKGIGPNPQGCPDCPGRR